ncbi:MAG TPA: hypothetical protein VER12_06445 [Polyangiaceae bacterium]|nr:hypothetical protein [Polyangiaceae bacterium]HYQ30683.1 hypothetical protein [Polyangiaceae bacterium]
MTGESRSSPPPPRHWFDPVFSQAAFVVPLIVSAFRASSASVWRDDLPIARALGLLPAGTEGRVTTVFVQLLSLLPLGGRWLRASWVGALSLALCSYLIYVLARRVLERAVHTPRLTPSLALAGALTATLALSFQLEGTVAGGAPLATALVLAGLLLGFETAQRKDARLSLALGALAGLTLSEAHAAALVLLFVLLVQGATHRVLPRPRTVLAFAAGMAVFWAFALLPLLLRGLTSQGGLDFGHGLDASSLALIDASGARSTALSSWLTDVGVISFGLAIAGLLVGLLRSSTRASMVPLLALVLADLAIPVSRVAGLTPDPFGALRLLAIAALAVCAALAVQTSAVALTRARIPFAQPASVLLVVFDFTLVFVGAEDSAFAADRRGEAAAEVWTDRALASVPADGLLLLRSEAIVWRLVAARIVRGQRPDIVVVPMPLLERGNVRARLLRTEPALAPLIREVALSGRASEYALSTLADARPLFVEFDPSFDRAELEHLVPQAFFMRFAPEPLGRSDRVAGLSQGSAEFHSVVLETERDGRRDLATRSVLMAETRGQALVAAALNDRKNLETILITAQGLDPEDALAREIVRQLKSKPRGELSLAQLLPETTARAR